MTIIRWRNSKHQKLVDGDEIKREKGWKKYIIVTREYMAQGHDGLLVVEKVANI